MFLAALVGQATGVLNEPSRAFEAGYVASEFATGAVQVVGGVVVEGVGGALDLIGVGVLVGEPINIAAAGVILQGLGNATVGLETFVHAVMRDPDPPEQPIAAPKPSEPASKPVEKPAAPSKPPAESL